jgi:hypothetical protein
MPLTSSRFFRGGNDPEAGRANDHAGRPRSIDDRGRRSSSGRAFRAYTQEEDAAIARAVLAGDRNYKDWSTLACTINALFDPPLLPKRNGKQIRDRWVNYLNPALNHEPWSYEEDVRLWRAHEELGKQWTVIGVEKFHTTRSENQIKNRWNSAAFRKFAMKEYGQDPNIFMDSTSSLRPWSNKKDL